MKNTFKYFIIFALSLAIICLSSCSLLGDGSKDNGPTGDTDGFGYVRPTNCWITDTILLNEHPTMDMVFGDKGDSGLLNDYAIEQNGKDLLVTTIFRANNYLACLIYSDTGKMESYDFETYLKFTLVNDSQVLYDEECVSVGYPHIYTNGGNFDVTLDMDNFADSRLRIFENEHSTREFDYFQALVVVPFELNYEGTLYADLRVDCPSLKNQVSYNTGSVISAEVDNDDQGTGSDRAEVFIKDFTASYLTEEKYNMGSFSDSDLMAEPSFDGNSANYMVMDFEYSPLQDIYDEAYINIMVRVPEATIMKSTIEEAPTGKIEEVTINNVTSIYASYNVPTTKGEIKKVRMIVRLTPLNEGVANVDVFLVGKGNAKATGNSYVTVSLVAGTPTIKYELSKDKKSYIASALWQSGLKEITVPDTYMDLPVKSIAKGLLKGNTKLEKLTIGNNVTSLNDKDFADCTALKTVVLGNGISSLPKNLFLNCTSLEEVTLPSGTTIISEGFFDGCSSLKTINNMSSVKTVYNFSFRGCKSLEEINCPSLTSIYELAFCGCSNIKTISAGRITTLKIGAFSNCSSLVSVSTLGVTTIPQEAFYGCTSLQWFSLEGYELIGKNAFANCKAFTEILIPDSLVRVEDGAFAGTSNVKRIYIAKGAYLEGSLGDAFDVSSVEAIEVESGNERFISENNCLIYQYSSYVDGSIVKKLMLGCKNSTIPEDVSYIGRAAFRNCASLTSVTFPEGLKEIDRYAFANCTGITSITIPSSMHIIWQYAFMGCSSLTSATFSSGTWVVSEGPGDGYVNKEMHTSSSSLNAKYLTETFLDKYIVHTVFH